MKTRLTTLIAALGLMGYFPVADAHLITIDEFDTAAGPILTASDDFSVAITVTPGVNESWNLGFATSVFTGPASLSWFEPENGSQVNKVATLDLTTLHVISDTAPPQSPASPDGTLQFLQINDSGGPLNGPINVVFNDHGDVPEPASIAVLGVGLVGLAMRRRRTSRRPVGQTDAT